MKLETAMKIKFYKEKIEDGEIVRVTAEFTFKSKNTAVLNPSQVKQALKEQQEYILEKIEEFINMGSDWHVEKILAFYINVARYNAARGSSYIVLPPYIKNKQACINVENKRPRVHQVVFEGRSGYLQRQSKIQYGGQPKL